MTHAPALPAGTGQWPDAPPTCYLFPETAQFRRLLEDALAGTLEFGETPDADGCEPVLVSALESDDGIAEARSRYPKRPLVTVVTHYDPRTIVAALGAGAAGVVALTDPPEVWRDCVRVVSGGGCWLGGPGLEVSLESKHTAYDVARRGNHEGDVTMRTRLFVRQHVGDKFRT